MKKTDYAIQSNNATQLFASSNSLIYGGIMNSRWMSRTQLKRVFLLTTLFTLLIAADAFSQVYQATLNQRRYGDQLHVDVWIRSLTSTAPKLGEASLVIQYNSSFLTPAAVQAPQSTDTVGNDADVAAPTVTVNSPFHNANGYQNLASQSYGSGFYSLEVRQATTPGTGFTPATTNRGTFIGKLIFDITNLNTLTDNTLSLVQWSASTLPGDIVIYDYSENNIESSVTFANPGNYTIRGITILNPNGPSEVVDRDRGYASVTVPATVAGYPIYFERSGLLATAGQYNTTGAAYRFEYSLDGGTSWVELGRSTEEAIAGSTDGEIFEFADDRGVHTSTGTAPAANGANIVRAVWETNNNFAARSENAKIRITQLATTGAIATRAALTTNDVSDNSFVLGRLFFMQLNGTDQYLRTAGAYSNATQLSVETWINLNAYNPTGSEVGVIAQSGGSVSGQEGAWMLYLKDGRFPAFRAREISGRGTNGYIGELISDISLPMASNTGNLGFAHAANWVHIAATVNNGRIRLYIDGNLVKEVNNTSAPNIRMMTNNHPIWVGVNPNGTINPNNYLNAGLKGIKVWRTELTQTQIRQMVAGVANPTTIGTNPPDPDYFKRGFELYYPLEGSRVDLANNATFQGGAQVVDFYQNGSSANNSARFRPDQPHLRLTSPSGCDGVSNLTGVNTTVRWVGYGIGDITADGQDLEIQFSTDGGTSWRYARNAGGTAAANDLGGGAGANVNIEAGEATWQAFNNDGTITNGQTGVLGNLRDVSANYSKSVLVRVRGFAPAAQGVTSSSQSLVVAPYFNLTRTSNAVLEVASGTEMNVTGQTFALEAWIRPHRFPTVGEVRFPIISKLDTATGKPHYSLSVLPSGRLELRVTDLAGNVRTAISPAHTGSTLVLPNSVDLDSAWSHVAVWVNAGNGSGASEVRFYIDGNVYRADSTASMLGNALALNTLNTFPAYIGSEKSAGVQYGFVGNLRDVRFWNGTPGAASVLGNEPTALTTHFQGALNVRGAQLTGGNATNLSASWDLNGGSFNDGNRYNILPASVGTVTALVSGGGYCYEAQRPVIKLVEPYFNQRIRNTTTNATLRWAGFYYNGGGFSVGSTGPVVNPSIEFSLNGGGGQSVQPYQHVAGPHNTGQAVSLTAGTAFGGMTYNATMDLTIADPDADNNGTLNDAGIIAAALTNARLRLSNTYTINGTASTVNSQSPLFSITPASNFTIRALFEGRHTGISGTFSALPSTFGAGGARIKLYQNNAGVPGALVATAESEFNYDAQAFLAGSVTNRNTNTGTGALYANIPFILTEISDGSYWVVLEQANHLPVMSRTPAPFLFSGDNLATTVVESGWTFTTWNGTDNDASYTAFGQRIDTQSDPNFSTTGLHLSEGSDGFTGANELVGVVAGDVVNDGQINASDRVRVRADAGTSLIRSDVTGDGNVNATDRSVVDRNFGKVSSVYNITFQQGIQQGGNPAGLVSNPMDVVSELDPELSQSMIAWAKETATIKPLALKKGNAVQGSVNFEVSAEPVRLTNSNIIEVPFYITNKGAQFGMGNATFAMQFNPKSLRYIGLTGTDKVIFTNKSARGYNNMYSAPRNDADRSLEGVRTIEIDYDAFARRGGEAVPTTKTYLGTLRFEMIGTPASLGFKWHQSTSVLDAQGLGLTESATLKPINGLVMYSASITAPAQNARIASGRNITTQWTATVEAPVYVEVSADNGSTWTRVRQESVLSSAKTLTFTAPSVLSNDVFVRLVDVETGTEIGRSRKFALVNISANVTRPSVADPIYVSGTNDAIRWTSSGLSKVGFEFSADNGTTWSAVSVNRNATDGSVSWRIPSANTKGAVVRMIDEDSKEEVSRSGMFKVLSGSVAFLNPINNEVLKANTTSTLRWRISNVVNLVDLQISFDGGATFTNLQSNVDAKKQLLDWTIPSVRSNNVVIRAIFPGEPELEYSRTPVFSIDAPSNVDIVTGEGYALSNPMPNPTVSMSVTELTLPTSNVVTVTLVNQLGETVATLVSNVEMTSGTHPILIPVETLANGTYYVRLNAGVYTETRKVVVVK